MSDRDLKDKNLFETLAEMLAAGIDPDSRKAELWERFGTERALLVLDSSGFSRVSEQYGIIHFLSRLVRMRRVVAAALEPYHDGEICFAADNIIASFESVDDAIRAAQAAHEAVRDEKLMLTETEPFHVCIGIGFGRMLWSESLEGYFGEEMNLASKLGEDIAEGGETLLTESAYGAASPELVDKYQVARSHISGLDLTHYKYRIAD